MEHLRLHFSNREQPDFPLPAGEHRLVRDASGHIGVGELLQGALLLRICVDRRGLWLHVPVGMRGLHVNGRPVQRMAQLHPGDAIYVDGIEMWVQADPLPASEPAPAPAHAAPDPRILLRGMGGRYHGRSFPLARPLLVGRAHEAAIRLDDPLSAERHAQLELHGERVWLRVLGAAEGCRVNGVPVQQAWLVAGDQVMFDSQQRFVVEVPWACPPAQGDTGDLPGHAPAPGTSHPTTLKRAGTVRRWPWLLLAALLLAAGLSALLLFGAG